MKKIVIALLAASVFVFAGCKKTGPPGPQGPQGPAGQTGASGQNGQNGLDGADANVFGSDPFTVSSWTFSGNIYSAVFTSSDITPDIVDFGIVSIFKSYGANEWSPLPDINGNTSTVFNFFDNGFEIYVQNSDGTDPGNPGSVTFRMVVISSALKQAYPNTDWKDYKAVTAAIQAFKANAATN